MKNLKLYEEYNIYKWKNIKKIKDKIYINIYQLADEMERTIINNRDSELVVEMEKEYCKLLGKLLKGKVVTFIPDDSYGTYYNKHETTGICRSISFFSNPYDSEYLGNEENQYYFSVDSMSIYLEDDDESYTISNDEELIIIHSDIDPNFYRDTRNFNL